MSLLGKKHFFKILYEKTTLFAFQVEGNTLVDDAGIDASCAVSCIMAANYVFGIQYPSGLRNTLTFIQHYLCGLSDTKPPNCVLRMYNMLV